MCMLIIYTNIWIMQALRVEFVHSLTCRRGNVEKFKKKTYRSDWPLIRPEWSSCDSLIGPSWTFCLSSWSTGPSWTFSFVYYADHWLFSVDCAVPASPVPQDGSSLLHSEGEGQARSGCPQEDCHMPGFHPGPSVSICQHLVTSLCC